MNAKTLAEFRAMQLAVLGSTTSKNITELLLEGIDCIKLGDEIQIKCICLTLDYVIVYLGDLSSYVHLSSLSDTIVTEIIDIMRSKALEMAKKDVIVNCNGVIQNWSA